MSERKITLSVNQGEMFDVLFKAADAQAVKEALGDRLISICLAEGSSSEHLGLAIYGITVEEEMRVARRVPPTEREQVVTDVVQPRDLGERTLNDYWKSLGDTDNKNMFSLGYQWADKPHRHVFDLIAYALFLEDKLKGLEAKNG